MTDVHPPPSSSLVSEMTTASSSTSPAPSSTATRYMTPPFSPVQQPLDLKASTSTATAAPGELIGGIPRDDPQLTGLGFKLQPAVASEEAEEAVDDDEADHVEPNEDEDTVRIAVPAAVAPLSPPAETRFANLPQATTSTTLADGQRTPTRPTHKPQSRSEVADWTRSTVTPELVQDGLPQPPSQASSSSTAASRKRATYAAPIGQSSSSSALSTHASLMGGATTLSPEYVVHPAIEAYRQAHPRRGIIYFGPYILLQTLGEGEFGKVKLGVHKDYGEEVAVKLIRRGSVNDQARLGKVEREIEVLRNVKHPNIVRLFDVIETEKYIGIILDFANGGELFDHILAHRYLKEKDAAKLFAQLISGVDYLHKKKIVHRDLKLENLLLDKHRNVIITDFGFANRFEHKKDDLMATSCGSPCYAAPELVISDGLYVGSAVDIWSCGVILYAMLSGYLPFDDDPANPDGDNINLLYRYIVNTPLTFPDYISTEARDLLSKMLVPDPEHRCSLADIMAHRWLAPYAPLFERSVNELEAIAHEQQVHKRAASRRDMQARMRVYEERRVRELAKQANVSSGVPPQNRHRSAMPTMSTVPMNLHTAGAASLPPSALIPSSAPADQSKHVVPASEEPPIPASVASDIPRTRAESMQIAKEDLLPPAPKEEVALPLPPSRPNASANKNRHTVQLEYDGRNSYEQMVKSHEEAKMAAKLGAPAPPVEAQHPRAKPVDVEMAEPVDIPPVSPNVPSELMSIDEKEVLAEPPTIPQTTETPPPAAPSAAASTESSKEESGKRNISATSISSESDRQDVKRFAPKPLPDKPLPPVASRSRRGKGLSMDRFGLAKLLSGTNSSSDSVPSAAHLKRSESARVKEQKRESRRPSNKENSPAPSPSAPTPVRVPSAENRRSPRPPSVVIQGDRILSPRPQDRSPSNPSITTFEAYSTKDPKTAGANASSSKAKKVMDWFRRKSMAKGPTEPVVQYPGGPGVLVNSATSLRVEETATSTPSEDLVQVPSTPRVTVTTPGPAEPTTPVARAPLAPEDNSVPRPVSAVEETILAPVGPPTVKRNQTQPLGKTSPVRQSPVRQSSGAPRWAGVASEAIDSRLRLHNGVVDQNALTAKSPLVVIKDIDRVLYQMGIETRRESEFKLRCTRVRRKKAAATTALGGSLASLSLNASSAASGGPASTSAVDRRGLPVPSSPSNSSLLGGGLRGMLMRRGSSQTGISALLSSPSDAGSPTTTSSNRSPIEPEPVYGDHTVDQGDEIRFSVELTRIKNLPGLYSVDIKRLRGNVWTYKFLYETVINRLDLTHH